MRPHRDKSWACKIKSKNKIAWYLLARSQHRILLTSLSSKDRCSDNRHSIQMSQRDASTMLSGSSPFRQNASQNIRCIQLSIPMAGKDFPIATARGHSDKQSIAFLLLTDSGIMYSWWRTCYKEKTWISIRNAAFQLVARASNVSVAPSQRQIPTQTYLIV
jgi:hypothetical protein